MNCEKNTEIQIDMLYGEVSGPILSEFHSHLDGCDNCRNDYNTLLHTKNFVSKSLIDVETPTITLNKTLIAIKEAQPTRFFDRVLTFFNAYKVVPTLVIFIFCGTLGLVTFKAYEAQQASSNFFAELTSDHMEEELSRGTFSPIGVGSDNLPLRERLKQNPFTDNSAYRLSSTGSALSASPQQNPYSFHKLPWEDEKQNLNAGSVQNYPSQEDLQSIFEQRRLALMEKDADDLLMRGRRLKSLGRVDLALKDFQTIYQFYPDYTYLGDVIMYKAQCNAFLGNKEAAVTDLKEFMSRYPDKSHIAESMLRQVR